jgi:hypothetical protein
VCCSVDAVVDPLATPSDDAPPPWKRFGPQPHVDVSEGVEASRRRIALVKHGTLVSFGGSTCRDT